MQSSIVYYTLAIRWMFRLDDYSDIFNVLYNLNYKTIIYIFLLLLPTSINYMIANKIFYYVYFK